jgi:hypothetical protein
MHRKAEEGGALVLGVDRRQRRGAPPGRREPDQPICAASLQLWPPSRCSASPRPCRKCFPGTQEQAVKAVVAGGGLPHRLGLSETLLVFPQHRAFCGGLEGFLPRIADLRRRVSAKKVLVEVSGLDVAHAVAAAGADGSSSTRPHRRSCRGGCRSCVAPTPT